MTKPSDAAIHAGETARRLVAGRTCYSACRDNMPWCTDCEEQVDDILESLNSFAAKRAAEEREACAKENAELRHTIEHLRAALEEIAERVWAGGPEFLEDARSIARRALDGGER